MPELTYIGCEFTSPYYLSKVWTSGRMPNADIEYYRDKYDNQYRKLRGGSMQERVVDQPEIANWVDVNFPVD